MGGDKGDTSAVGRLIDTLPGKGADAGTVALAGAQGGAVAVLGGGMLVGGEICVRGS